jgi:hypothetical protein
MSILRLRTPTDRKTSRVKRVARPRANRQLHKYACMECADLMGYVRFFCMKSVYIQETWEATCKRSNVIAYHMV